MLGFKLWFNWGWVFDGLLADMSFKIKTSANCSVLAIPAIQVDNLIAPLFNVGFFLAGEIDSNDRPRM